MMNLYVLLSRGEKGKLETMEHHTLSQTEVWLHLRSR